MLGALVGEAIGAQPHSFSIPGTERPPDPAKPAGAHLKLAGRDVDHDHPVGRADARLAGPGLGGILKAIGRRKHNQGSCHHEQEQTQDGSDDGCRSAPARRRLALGSTPAQDGRRGRQEGDEDECVGGNHLPAIPFQEEMGQRQQQGQAGKKGHPPWPLASGHEETQQ